MTQRDMAGQLNFYNQKLEKTQAKIIWDSYERVCLWRSC